MVIHLVGGLPVMVRITFLVRIGWLIQSGTSNLARYCIPPTEKIRHFWLPKAEFHKLKDVYDFTVRYGVVEERSDKDKFPQPMDPKGTNIGPILLSVSIFFLSACVN